MHLDLMVHTSHQCLLIGFISPRCLCLGKTTSSGIVLIIMHNNYSSNYLPKFLSKEGIFVAHAEIMTLSCYSVS